MKQQYKIVKRNLNRFKKSDYFRARFYYTKFYETLDINENQIVFQSYDGSSFTGNNYYIFKAIYNNSEYDDFEKIVVAKDCDSIRKYLEEKGMDKNVTVVKIHSKEYCKALASAKYLFNNATFVSYFIKKEGQVYLNTWHGTPLKNMGKQIKSAPNELGNTQRNFLMCDYMLNPNDFTFEHMKEDYMLDNLFKNKYVVSGYPRNSAFFDKERAMEIRAELEVEDKQVSVYMPTWRGAGINNKSTNEQTVYIMYTLYELDKKVNDDVVIYVKLHNYTSSQINFKNFKHIRNMPAGYETYEFLNMADCLITDYSSVFFDFANTGKKIVLYAYDREEYLATRGMYLDYNALPFVFADNVEQLIKEVNNVNDYTPYPEFNAEFNNYDGKDAADRIVDLVFHKKQGNNMRVIDGKTYNNGKDTVLVFVGGLLQNGITTAAKGLINNADKEKYNYVITFFKNAVEKNKKSIHDFIGVDYMPIQGPKDLLVREAVVHFLYYRCGITFGFIRKQIEQIYKREITRIFPNMKFAHAIHYSGYESKMMDMIKAMDTDRIMYIHSDMYKETKSKNNLNQKVYRDCLEKYDKIVCIRETSKQEIIAYNNKIRPDHVFVAHNLNNIQTIREKALLPLAFDKDTYCNVSEERLAEILKEKNCKKYINIGRFSPEKGHGRLISAFLEYAKENPNDYLFIVGGYGKTFNETMAQVEESGTDKIIIVRHISNPYSILNACDVFVLSSFYEGLPMTIMEALILNKVIVSTNIKGPAEFLEQGYGYLVEDSEEGILKGLQDYNNNNITGLIPFDAEGFNQKALDEFEAMLEA